MKYDRFLVALVKFMRPVHVKLLHPGSILITILEKNIKRPIRLHHCVMKYFLETCKDVHDTAMRACSVV